MKRVLDFGVALGCAFFKTVFRAARSKYSASLRSDELIVFRAEAPLKANKEVHERHSNTDAMRGSESIGIADQGRMRHITDRGKRIGAMQTLTPRSMKVTSSSRQTIGSHCELNAAVEAELQRAGAASLEEQHTPTLIPPSDLTVADRQWAAKYQAAEVLHYTAGSRSRDENLGLKRGSYANLTAVDPEANRITARREDGREVTYDPKRLQGVSAYHEIGSDFAKGDQIQFTAPVKDIWVAKS